MQRGAASGLTQSALMFCFHFLRGQGSLCCISGCSPQLFLGDSIQCVRCFCVRLSSKEQTRFLPNDLDKKINPGLCGLREHDKTRRNRHVVHAVWAVPASNGLLLLLFLQLGEAKARFLFCQQPKC